MGLFLPLKFMLASPASDNLEIERLLPSPFVVEDKYDGIRAQAHAGPDLEDPTQTRVALFSRTLDDISRAFPDLLEPLQSLLRHAPRGLMLDGEIVPINLESGAILPFQELQKRLGRKSPTPQVLGEIPVAFIAYDALFFDGESLLDEPFSQRREKLESLQFDNVRTILTPSRMFENVDDLDAEFEAARARGNEGLMAKDPRATYKPGRRGKEWLKIKKALATLDVVVTSVEVGSGRRAKFLSDYTFAVRASEDDPTLLNVGKAYSGLTDAEVEELSTWFREHTTAQYAHGKVRVVEPKIVFEVTFDRVQPSPRHKSGYALRFPRILRVRTDKTVDEIDTLDAVKKLAG
jgi:DNA ligase-1